MINRANLASGGVTCVPVNQIPTLIIHKNQIERRLKELYEDCIVQYNGNLSWSIMPKLQPANIDITISFSF
jgi:hypothetical protein